MYHNCLPLCVCAFVHLGILHVCNHREVDTIEHRMFNHFPTFYLLQDGYTYIQTQWRDLILLRNVCSPCLTYDYRVRICSRTTATIDWSFHGNWISGYEQLRTKLSTVSSQNHHSKNATEVRTEAEQLPKKKESRLASFSLRFRGITLPFGGETSAQRPASATFQVAGPATSPHRAGHLLLVMLKSHCAKTRKGTVDHL